VIAKGSKSGTVKRRKASARRKLPKRSVLAVEEASARYGNVSPHAPFRFLEFFAGGGMARAGLAPDWAPVWANDLSSVKAEIYRQNWGGAELVVRDVAGVSPNELPEAEMAWGSFPCQDLSLAGNQSGIGEAGDGARTRSGTFWPFWNLIEAKRPPIVVLENVKGALTSNGGRDIEAICSAMAGANYRFGPLVIDAMHWVPQSRGRLFIVAVDRNVSIPVGLTQDGPDKAWHTQGVQQAFRLLKAAAKASWLWWQLPSPESLPEHASTLIDKEPSKWVEWDSPEKTRYLMQLMTRKNHEKVRKAQLLKRRVVGFAYRRTRAEKQRLEIRFDGIAGCLRTAAGGSSKQIVVEVIGDRIRTRLLSPREAARLQGLPDEYFLPDDYNAAYDLVGDGLCVPVVRFLGDKLLTPLAFGLASSLRAIA
jgi:DNA (cytosine-5)-methyltransferase 1